MQFLLLFVSFLIVNISGWRIPSSIREKQVNKVQNNLKNVLFLSVISSATISSIPSISLASQGAIKSSTLQESKDAVKSIQIVLDDVNSFDKLVEKKEFETIAEKLSSKPFQTFSDSCQTLVRSEVVSAEDKVALGTIKRYGVVADAIIMIGGIGAELKAGGYNVAGGDPKQTIEYDGDSEDGEKPEVNVSEVKRYTKLASGSLQDILRIGSPILNK